MRYLPLTDKDREEIKTTIGINNTKELFTDIPQSKLYFSLDNLPTALSEGELKRAFKNFAEENKFHEFLSFLGGGAYQHEIPEVVNYLSGRGEFLTPYTPYQPEVSQGSLQAMYEYQTMMTMLTGMDISNCSLYDGGTAAAEGMLLALRKSRKNKILAAANIHPEYIEIMKTYVQNLDYDIEFVNYEKETGKLDLEDLKSKIDSTIGGFIFQSPNFFGVIEESNKISELIHTEKAFSIQVIAEAMSLAFLNPPGENGVDIVVGEAQSFGIPLSFGGPFLGFIAANKDFVRQMPGRIVGQTIDSEGSRGYVLTLSTREQHIKRERATSNICTNQAWCGLRAGIYLITMGKNGLTDISKTNHLNTAYFVKEISRFSHIEVKYKKNFYNEIVLEIKTMNVKDFLEKLQSTKILAGIPLGWFFPEYDNSILINFTEIHKKEDIDTLINAIGELK
jgi:glycine dehydrogenase subunit 1